MTFGAGEAGTAVVLGCVGGTCQVLLPDGREVIAWPRGRLRREGAIVAGDRVMVSVAGEPPVYAVVKVLPRRTFLPRPPVANVDQVLLVMALAQPDPSLELLDRLTVVAALAGVEPIIVFNKVDLVAPAHARALAEGYCRLGYRVVLTNARTGEGAAQVRGWLAGKITALAGPSGAGKSTLANQLLPGVRLQTGEVSPKTGRGRHVTRAARLLPLPEGGLVCDTPGFGRLDFPVIEPALLATCFPEMGERVARCRFRTCLHKEEPGCEVRESMLGEGGIFAERYRHYRLFLEEVEESWRRRYQE